MKRRKQAVKFLREWMPKFGFGHYLLVTDDAPDDARVWADVSWNHEEEWLLVRFHSDLERLSKRQVEHVVCHELTHALISFANTGEVAEEAACNRVAGMLTNFMLGCRQLTLVPADVEPVGASKPFTDEERELLLDVMPVLVTHLPEPYRTTLIDHYYRDKTVRAIAEEHGVHKNTVQNRLNHGRNLLRELVRGTA